MDHIAVKFAPSMEKGNVLALIAREAGLKAEDLRVLVALFLRSVGPGRDSATFADLVAATALAPERVEAAVAGLLSRRFIEIVDDAKGAPANAPPGPKAPRRAPGRRGLDPGIMNYDLDIEGLIRAGDAMARDIRSGGIPPASPAPAAPSSGASGWNPLSGEDSRPAAMRFAVWLRFVLSPDELEACEGFAIAHKAAWDEFIDRFGGAKAAGREAELLEDLRRRIRAFVEGPRDGGAGGEGHRAPPHH